MKHQIECAELASFRYGTFSSEESIHPVSGADYFRKRESCDHSDYIYHISNRRHWDAIEGGNCLSSDAAPVESFLGGVSTSTLSDILNQVSSDNTPSTWFKLSLGIFGRGQSITAISNQIKKPAVEMLKRTVSKELKLLEEALNLQKIPNAVQIKDEVAAALAAKNHTPIQMKKRLVQILEKLKSCR